VLAVPEELPILSLTPPLQPVSDARNMTIAILKVDALHLITSFGHTVCDITLLAKQ
jgi:hypothetical protein